jgi:co-chaperonin GroES (HSP10)
MNNPSGLDPRGWKVVVQPEEVKKVTSGGVHLPDETTERWGAAMTRGVVLAVGPNAFERFKEPHPKAGDLVTVPRYGGMEFKGVDGKDYRILNDEDVAAVVEDDG